ncbi:hypothetical protein [Leifsonia shinshuensis]
MKSRNIAGGITAVVVALGLSVAGTLPANAAESSSALAVGQTVVVTTPMHVGGFDAAIAQKDGFQLVTGADGITRSVPVTAAAKAATGGKSAEVASPDGTVSGDCGISSLAISKSTTEDIREVTSYRVDLVALSQHWIVDAISPEGSYEHNFSGLNDSTTWTGIDNDVYVYSSEHGVIAHVESGSFAELFDGEICYSGGPTSSV